MASDFRYINSASSTIIDGSGTRYRPVGGNLQTSATEAETQGLIRDSYTGKNLFVYCSAFSGTGTHTVASQKSGAAGNLTVTITTTGIFEDTVNTDSLVDGNLYNTVFTVSGGMHGDLTTIQLTALSLSHASSDLPILMASSSSSVTSTASYRSLDGSLDSNVTEANRQRTVRVAATLSNFRTHCTTYGSDITGRVRVNGVNGNQVITITTTGSFEDTVNTDTIAVGDEVNYSHVAASTSGTITIAQVKSASVARQHMASGSRSQSFSAVVDYIRLSGTVAGGDTEAWRQVTMRTTNVLKNLFVSVSAYTLDVAATVAVRINGVTSAISVSPNTTGIFEDTVNSVTLVATDEANYISDTTAATSGSYTRTLVSIEETQPSTVNTEGGEHPFREEPVLRKLQIIAI